MNLGALGVDLGRSGVRRVGIVVLLGSAAGRRRRRLGVAGRGGRGGLRGHVNVYLSPRPSASILTGHSVVVMVVSTVVVVVSFSQALVPAMNTTAVVRSCKNLMV